MTLPTDWIEAITALLDDTAASQIMPRWRNLEAGAIRSKSGPLDLVTEADEAAEHAITGGLRALFPHCVVVGEEATERDRKLLDRIGGAELAFVVDPVDGTANFAAGLPLFGTMCAAIRNGETVAAWIHDPVGRDTAVAVKGEGAWIVRPDASRTRLSVASPAEPARMAGCASWAWMPEDLRFRVLPNLGRTAGAWCYRCAAHEYRLMAGGHIRFLVYNKLMPWDHAPGVLLVQEAGGFCARFDASPYAPTLFSGGLLAAPDAVSWHGLHALLFAE